LAEKKRVVVLRQSAPLYYSTKTRLRSEPNDDAENLRFTQTVLVRFARTVRSSGLDYFGPACRSNQSY